MKLRLRLITISLSLLSGQVFAGGFQLSEHSTSGLGNAYAGAGAIGEDASTNFYNPAALSCLPHPQIMLSGVFINLNEDVKIISATRNAVEVVGNDREEAAPWVAIPSIHIAFPCNNFVFGFGADIPWGLSTSYTASSKSRYFATYSGLATVNLGPTIAYSVNDWFSIGGGFDAEYADVTLKQGFFPAGFPAGDSIIKNEGNSWGYGWNLGVLFNLNNGCTRIGAHYRSLIREDIEGDASLKTVGGTTVFTGDVEGTVKLPDTANISIVQEINPCWAILGSVFYTHWNVLDTVTLHYGGAFGAAIPEAHLDLNFKDAFKYALAVNFTPDDCWKLRLGVAYDESPVRSKVDRTFRLPDNNRVWLSMGAQYHASDCLVFDVGYSHIFKADTKIDQTTNVGGSIFTAQADDDGSANLFGVQVAWNFV